MKNKIILTLTALMITVTASCYAADGSFIGAEQKAAEIFADGLMKLSQTEARYNSVAKYFHPELQKKFDETKFENMRNFLRDQYGSMSELKFKGLQREDDGDSLFYQVKGRKIPSVLLQVIFDKEKKIVQFNVGPEATKSKE